jgi:hypothetical protein
MEPSKSIIEKQYSKAGNGAYSATPSLVVGRQRFTSFSNEVSLSPLFRPVSIPYASEE